MKIQKAIFYILMFLPLPVTAISLAFLPDQIPAHYGLDGEVTRWGSKYETLVFPAMNMVLGVILLGLSKYAAKLEKQGNNNEKTCIIAGICSFLVLNVMTAFFLYTDLKKVEDLSAVSVDVSRLVFILLGIFLIVIGNIMPKIRMNAVLGLRTKWSMKNEKTWKKSQRFGGISFMAVGLPIILICCFTKGLACVLWSMGILLLSLPIDIYYTYKVAKEDRTDQKPKAKRSEDRPRSSAP